MPNLLTTIQSIAVNAVNSTIPVQYCCGTVSGTNPLSIRLNESTLEITGESILLTEPVVEKLLTIDKHNHQIGSLLGSHTHNIVNQPVSPPEPAPPEPPIGVMIAGVTINPNEINQLTEVVNKVISGKCTEHKKDLPVDSNSERIVITLNRALEKGDKVLMIKVSAGQRFIVLSRIFDQ